MARFRPLSHHSLGVWVAIASFGALGSVLRYAITADGGWGAVVLANVLGCGVLGVLVARGRATPALGVGFCGGLTTFSGVAAQALTAAQGDAIGAASTAGDFALRLAPGAGLMLAVNGILGLVAFLAGRHLSGPRSSGRLPDAELGVAP